MTTLKMIRMMKMMSLSRRRTRNSSVGSYKMREGSKMKINIWRS